MKRNPPLHRLALAALLLAAVPALGQAPPDRQASAGDALAAARAVEATYTFQIVLLIAEVDGPTAFENVPPNAQKALKDVQEFLPYKSYRLLDLAWLRSSGSAEAQLSGLEGQTLSAALRFRALDESGELEIRRFVVVPHRELTYRLQPGKDAGGFSAAPAPVRPLLESSFGMRAGETVVVGTAKLDGPTKALVVLLTALP
jgi:hypothetical protein